MPFIDQIGALRSDAYGGVGLLINLVIVALLLIV